MRVHLLIVCLLVGCADSRVQPAGPSEPGPPLHRGIHRIIVDATDVALAPGEYAELSARALDANSQPIAGVKFNWSTSNATVASVTSEGVVQARAAGTATITAVAEGRAGTISIAVLVQRPVVAAITPQSVAAGDSVTLLVEGSSFYRGSVVEVNGHAVATTPLFSHLLHAHIPLGRLDTAGVYGVRVWNNIPGGGRSNEVELVVR